MMRFIYTFLFIFVSFIYSGLSAQSLQQVQVLEYLGKEQKKPLNGVSISVQNAASAISDDQGRISLQFRTLKPGEAVQVRRIDLAGYEVFNQEVVDAWTISEKQVFTLVLCRSDRFKALCDQYNAAASASYEHQLQKDKAALTKLRQEGKIRQQEYEEQLAALEKQYNEQLDNLENYVERFARIDLSEISEEEQLIIELVQQGNFTEAIRKYEEMDLLSKYQQQSVDIQQVRLTQEELTQLSSQKQEVRDSLIQILQQQIRLYEQQGNQQKADSLRKFIESNK